MKRKHYSVLWFLSGSEEKASSRLHGYLVHRELVRRGFLSKLIFAPRCHDVGDYERFFRLPVKVNLTGVVSVIQKLDGSNTDKLSSWLRWCGSTVVYVGCDIRVGQESWRNSDVLFVTSTLLREYYEGFSVVPVSIAREPYDFSFPPKASSSARLYEGLKIAWFGNKGNWGALERWREIIESEYLGKFRLITCSNHPDADFSWSLDNLRLLLSISDIAVLPTQQGMASGAKSPNRLIQCMAVGLPTIAGPLVAYQELQVSGAPVLIANDDNEFRRYLDMLLSSSCRMEVAWVSYQMVAESYAIGSVANEWAELMRLECANGFKKILLCSRLIMIDIWLKISGFLARYCARTLRYIRSVGGCSDKQC